MVFINMNGEAAAAVRKVGSGVVLARRKQPVGLRQVRARQVPSGEGGSGPIGVVGGACRGRGGFKEGRSFPMYSIYMSTELR